MTAARPEPKPTSRGLWLVVVVVVGLLALSTWDTVRKAGENSPAALRRAAFDGDEEKVRRILVAHPEWVDLSGSTNTPIHPGAGFGEIVQIAVGKPAPSPSSAEGRREEEFREIEASGATALVHAVMQKRDGIVLMLLSAGAKVKVNSSYGQPLVVQVIINGDTNTLAAFERRGAMTLLAVAGWEEYVLHAAVHSRRAEMVQFMMRRGPRAMEMTNSAGGTPLWLAIAVHRLDLVQLLTTNGANWARISVSNMSALQFAREMATGKPSSNANAIVAWLKAYTATNQPPAKPVP